MHDHPFLRLDSSRRSDMLVDAAHVEVLRQGSAFVSLRSLAARMDMTPAGLVHLFGGKRPMLATLAGCYGARWSGCFGPRIGWEGVHGALPRDEQEREGTTVWLALHALGRAEPGVAEQVDRVRFEERAALARVLAAGPAGQQRIAAHAGPPSRATAAPTDADLDLLVATIDGLRHAMTATTGPLPLDRALVALARVVPLVGPETAPDQRAPS